MKILLFFTLSFILSFFILSIPIKKKTLFIHLSDVTSPLTEAIFDQAGNLFENADPHSKEKHDEDLKDSERKELENIMK